MDLIILILGIACIGFLVWLITTYIPMEQPFKVVIYVVAAIVLVLWLVRHFRNVVPNVMP